MADTSLREGAREVADQAHPGQLEEKAQEALQNQPLLPHLLSFKVVLAALAIAGVVAVLLVLLGHGLLGAAALVLLFFGSWFGLAARSYSKSDAVRRAESGGDEDGDEDDS